MQLCNLEHILYNKIVRNYLLILFNIKYIKIWKIKNLIYHQISLKDREYFKLFANYKI